MIHPSYTELMQVVNSNVEGDETPVCNSRYSIVLATSKRARQIIAGADPMVAYSLNKPLSIAVEELYKGKVEILPEEDDSELTEEITLEEVTEETAAEEEGNSEQTEV